MTTKKHEVDSNIYKTIVENLGVEIFVSDGEGNVLFVNPESIEINALDVDNVIGRNVRDLLSEGYFEESSTLRVLKEKKTVSVLLHLTNGKQIIATGVPMFDDKGDISMVFTTSQDIEAVNDLLETLHQQQQEIQTLKRELSRNIDFETIDPASVKVRATLERVSSMDIPVLISGESGTGKHVAARYIHFFGRRSEEPFIVVNCTSDDSDFLEREIFGQEIETSDGKTRSIRQGKLDFADRGTLALNNISYMPLRVQSKLFEYIDTGKFKRAGSDHEVSSSARIVAMTGMDLQSLSETGMFMKSLYYRLATVPISIPPLRNRIKDIPYLANQYVSRYNNKYKTRKILSRDALGKLASHSWPGNLIELDQAIESAYIMSDGPVILGDTIYEVLHGGQDNEDTKGSVYCEDIIPLKEAKHQLEEQLVKRAFEVYKTTHKTAEALGVNQSTVSRILNKYKK
ncbi:MAG: sigma 54-interacting transcriptional regulator [Firmicutes bacterium]|nr:sigma 54-interacting transcriptional regulator [Bacillota bacterium]